MNIRSVDEAVVIGAALSLSSSAFVLQVFVCFECLFKIEDKQGLFLHLVCKKDMMTMLMY